MSQSKTKRPKVDFKNVRAEAAHLVRQHRKTLAIGLVRIPVQYNTPTTSLLIGTVFVFLMVWAVAAPFMRKKRPLA